jgi:DNA-binding CsgD family transcriptional regulator
MAIPDVAPPGSPLTARELEVLVAYAAGNGAKGVGAALGISIHTVRHHLEHIRSRLGVSSTAAAVFAVRDQLP